MIDKKISNEALVALLQQDGNMRYFSILSERHEAYILKKCKSYVKDKDVAEDLCQEILIKLFLKLKDFKGNARFSTWLYAIIHNTCIDYLRKHKRIDKVITEKMADEVSEMIDGVDELPEELSIEILENLLDQISSDEKLILLLKYKEKHPIRDIQITLGLSESAVKMRLKRAKTKVNELYLKYKKKPK